MILPGVLYPNSRLARQRRIDRHHAIHELCLENVTTNPDGLCRLRRIGLSREAAGLLLHGRPGAEGIKGAWNAVPYPVPAAHGGSLRHGHLRRIA